MALELGIQRERIFVKIIRQALPVLLLYSIFELFAGLGLIYFLPTFNLLPGALILVPAIMDMRGNIISALSSRLSTATHLGFLKGEDKQKTINENIKASLGTSLVVSAVAGFAAHFVTIGLGLESIGLLKFIFAAIIAGTLSGISLTGIAVGATLVTSHTRLDPDNVVQPIVAAIGDILSIFWVFLAIRTVLGL